MSSCLLPPAAVTLPLSQLSVGDLGKQLAILEALVLRGVRPEQDARVNKAACTVKVGARGEPNCDLCMQRFGDEAQPVLDEPLYLRLTLTMFSGAPEDSGGRRSDYLA